MKSIYIILFIVFVMNFACMIMAAMDHNISGALGWFSANMWVIYNYTLRKQSDKKDTEK